MKIDEAMLLKNLIDSIHGLKGPLDQEKPDAKGVEMIRILGDEDKHVPLGLGEAADKGGDEEDDAGSPLEALLGGGDSDEEMDDNGGKADDEEDGLYDLIKRLKG